MAATFEVYEDRAGLHRWRLKAGDGEVIATGESYPTRVAALRGVDGVKRAAAQAEVVALVGR